MVATPTPLPHKRALIAPLWHTLVFLLILTGITLWGLYLNRLPPPHVNEGPQAPQHGNALLLGSSLVGEWLLVYYVFGGVHDRGGLKGLTGGRWKTWRGAALDLAIAAPFWVLWTAMARLVWSLIGSPQGPRGPLTFPPHGWFDISLWFAVSITAGFCEEIIYRGYFQQQIRALTGSATIAVVGQAILFGLGHTYQGWKPVFVITMLGVLYGLLAHWRGNLRPGMISHAWSDLFEGYFRHIWA